jgi:hypothetical protein
MARQLKVNRVVTGTKIPYPCGDPTLSPDADLMLRRAILKTCLTALGTDVKAPTVFTPEIAMSSG